MVIINTTDIPSETVNPLAQQVYIALSKRNISRPSKKALSLTIGTLSDIPIYIVDFAKEPKNDKIIIVNANPFVITNAVNEEVTGDLYPTLYWKGGVAPFVIKLVYQSVDGNTIIYDVDTMNVNIDDNLTDGTGDITYQRDYIMMKKVEEDGWWVDDLEIEDLNHKNAIGLQITDDLGRTLFAPFKPDTATIYTEYGPETWCVPTIHWAQPSPITYGEALTVGTELAAYTHIPGTSTALPGEFFYWLDAAYTTPAENVVPNANTGLPLYTTFQATDDVHYHLAEYETGIVVNKATPNILWSHPQSVDYNAYYNVSLISTDTSGVATFNPPNNTHITAMGDFTGSITFTPTDLNNYNIVNDSYTIHVNKIAATISITAGLTQTWSSSEPFYGVSINTTPSGLTYGVTYDGSTQAPTMPGTYNVVAWVIDNIYEGTTSDNMVVNKATPVFTDVDDITGTYPADVSQGYITSSSGATVTLSTSNSTVCTVLGNMYQTTTNAGDCLITASCAATDTYAAANNITVIGISIAKANQTISVYTTSGTCQVGNYGSSLTVGGASGNPVILSSSNEAIATISGSNIYGVSRGTVTIYGNQAGNSNYNAAPQVNMGNFIVKDWVTLAEYTCGQISVLQYWIGNGYWSALGTYIRKVDPTGTMAVTWGYSYNNTAGTHSAAVVPDLLDITSTQLNNWAWNGAQGLSYDDIHILKVEKYM